MFTIWKRNAVVITVLVFVCVAVYLNWSYTRLGDSQTGKTLGEATLVDGEDAGGAVDEADVYADTDLADYFATARLTRQQARDSALALLNETAAADNAAQSVRDEANESIQAMAAYTLAEAQIENLVTAKGYADCIAFISTDGISVVVAPPEGGLTTADVAKITDIITDQTSFATEQIKIVAAS
ncbi:SpoIIIAH-like family protein [Papillibacter cinnamivorans]|uniref:Stage III sporulation protein AH n=1 Tax=Papillibacter cinnamivorans DSM 12816 TaxID=1122930 RepID=A0A1W2CJX1_9FIRM|nr:SpoIIIAH-like family protein [Papillibacter cinnamivorans]SMC85537.1 stage III sporulation protein AH [Papillibacter cinnamivorans DSM 12816]